jgi:hypothetical protein
LFAGSSSGAKKGVIRLLLYEELGANEEPEELEERTGRLRRLGDLVQKLHSLPASTPAPQTILFTCPFRDLYYLYLYLSILPGGHF